MQPHDHRQRQTPWFDWIHIMTHPRLWQGVAKFRRIPFETSMRHSFVRLVFLPVFLGTPVLVASTMVTSTTSPSSLLQYSCIKTVLWDYIISPWTIYWTWRGLLQPVYTIFQTMRGMRSWHNEAEEEARTNLATAVQEKRAIITKDYYMYLPPPPPSPTSHTEPTTVSGIAVVAAAAAGTTTASTTTAILFLPGMGVDHAAYACVAEQLAQQGGYFVVVVSMEPLRTAFSGCGGESARIEQIKCSVEEQLQSLEQVETTTKRISTWHLMGHSLGGFCATHLIECEPHDTTGGSSCLVLWGAAPFVDQVSDKLRLSHRNVLIVQGNQDGVFKMVKQQQEDEEQYQKLVAAFEEKFPKATTVTHIIEGGTHQGFAHYTSKFLQEENDGSSGNSLGRREQQRQAVQATVKFLEQHHGGGSNSIDW